MHFQPSGNVTYHLAVIWLHFGHLATYLLLQMVVASLSQDNLCSFLSKNTHLGEWVQSYNYLIYLTTIIKKNSLDIWSPIMGASTIATNIMWAPQLTI